MDNSEDMGKDTRIKKIKHKLKSLLKNIGKDKLQIADGLITRVAFMQTTLEDLEEDINENGTTELFSQTKDVEYERERPSSAIYNKLIKNYTTATKQLFDLLPDNNNDLGIPKDGEKLLKFIASGGK